MAELKSVPLPDDPPNKVKHMIAVIPLSQMTSYPGIQRPFGPARLKRLQENYDVNKLGLITVNKRGERDYSILDGQHRRKILQDKGVADAECVVHEGLSPEAEAEVALGLNSALASSNVTTFLRKVAAGRPTACAINKIVRDNGMTVSATNSSRNTSAVRALEKAYLSGPHILNATLSTARAAWPKQEGALQGAVIEGLALFFNRYGTKLDREGLVSRLSARLPRELIAQAKASAVDLEIPAAMALARYHIYKLYNAGRRSGKLPPWASRA